MLMALIIHTIWIILMMLVVLVTKIIDKANNKITTMLLILPTIGTH